MGGKEKWRKRRKKNAEKKNRGGKRGFYPTIFKCLRRLRLPMAVRPIISPEQRRLLEFRMQDPDQVVVVADFSGQH